MDFAYFLKTIMNPQSSFDDASDLLRRLSFFFFFFFDFFDLVLFFFSFFSFLRFLERCELCELDEELLVDWSSNEELLSASLGFEANAWSLNNKELD